MATRGRKSSKSLAAEGGARARSGQGGGGGRLRWLRILLGVVILGAIVGVGGVAGLFLYFGNDPNLPNFEKLSDYKPPQTTRVLDRHGTVIGTLGPQRRTLVPYGKIPKILVQAVISAEDPTYFEHEGIDYRGIARAFLTNVFSGRIFTGHYGQGGSTITQQVVKQMLLTPEKKLRRKVQEMILARRLSQKLSKEEILEIYLNQINYGHGRYGCEEGARFYFNKSVTQIGLAEAAFLAGVPQIPERLSPFKNPEGAKRRQEYVLAQMVKHGYIEQKTADKVGREPLAIVSEAAGLPDHAAEAVDTVYRSLVEKFGREAIPTLGIEVKTTIDLKLQDLAREALERGLEDLDARQGYRGRTGHLAGRALEKRRAELAAARKGTLKDSVVVEGIVERVERDPKDPAGGKLIVDVGGLEGAVDLAAEVRYGKGPKPLAERFVPGDLVRVRAAPERRRIGDKDDKTLLLALELGPQAAMVVLDPQTREVLALVGGYNYRPGGFDRSQRALRQAGSAFKPFLYGAAMDTGRYTAATIMNDAAAVYELWKPKNHGNTFRGPVPLREAFAESINTIPIQLLSEVGIPVVKEFARKAGLTTPMPDDLGLAMALGAGSVTPIELANAYATFASGGRHGEPRLVNAMGAETPPAPPLEPVMKPETAFLTVSLMKSVVEKGTGRAASRLNRPIAGKTGTANDSKDAWFVGFTPDLLAGVWVGFDDGKALGAGEAGARSALPIWIDFMGKALANRPVRDFAQPPGITVVRIDPATGLLAPGTEGVDEVFIAGTEPKESAPQGEGSNADKALLERGL